MTSCSVMFLLIASRRRWLPASGAKVNPLLRTRCTSSSSRGVMLSMRSDGSERSICSCSAQPSIFSINSVSWLWSLVEREESETSS